MTIPVVAVAVVLFVSGGVGAASTPTGGPTFCCASYVSVANAFDGNPATFWQGAYNAEDTSAVAPYDVTSWRLIYAYTAPQLVTGATVSYFYDSRFIAANARFDCSVDGTAWTPLASVPANQQSATVSFTATACQWVSLYMEPASTTASPAVADISFVASPAPPSAPTFTTATSLVAVGDSITAGSYAPVSWPSLLLTWREFPIYNQGVSGNNTAQMLARFPTVLATGGKVVSIMGGTNDCQEGISTPTSVENIDSMVQQAKTAGRLPLIIGPIPRAGNTDAGSPFTSCLRALREALSSLASTDSVAFADPWAAFESSPGSGQPDPSLLEDSAHPDARGAFLLARVVAHAAGWGFSGD